MLRADRLEGAPTSLAGSEVGVDGGPLVDVELSVDVGVETRFELGAGHRSTARASRSRSIARALVSLALIAAGETPSIRLISWYDCFR